MRTAYSVLRIGALSGASFGAYCVLRTAYCVFEALSGANFVFLRRIAYWLLRTVVLTVPFRAHPGFTGR